jgi:plastocyanin
MRQRRTLLPFCLAVCLAAPVAWAAEVSVNVISNSFAPSNVTIQVGDTVTWTNSNRGFHNVVSDEAGFRSGDATENWTFSHTFNSAGVFDYYCEPHQFFGMTGTVTVQDDGGGEDDPGTLRFSLTSYTVSEGAGTATITVNRVNGDDGAASVQWAATAGTATAGSDFTAASGTLNWANSDDANKTFQITIVNDTADESNETINLTLSNATGAALDNTRRTATLTITDNDDGSGGGSAPAAPTNLRADAQSTTEIRLDWTDAAGNPANNETGFRIERRTLTGTFQEVGTVGANTTSFVAGGLSSGTFYVFRVRAQNSAGNSAFSNEAGAAPNEAPLPCLASATALCVNSNRFQVEVQWRTPDGSQPQNGPGQAVPIPSAPDSGLFYFFSPSNLEMLLKVLNGCGLNNRYWVFFAATTNVEFGVTVTDTQSGRVKSYFNPLGRPAPPIQDTDAFATCP